MSDLPAVVLLGVATGLQAALLGVGIVLIYRANRFINFAYGSMGSFVGDGISLQASPGMMSPQYKAMYLAAAETCPGLPAEVLMAIGQIESGHGANDGPSYAGAIGPMQFMPATWVGYGVDGNHDGFADPFDPADAIPSAARLLCTDGAGNPKTLMDAAQASPNIRFIVTVGHRRAAR